MKATDLLVTYRFLEDRAAYLKANDWPVSKWILFARDLLEAGYTVHLYEARNTVSKYLTIIEKTTGKEPVKVRFSNHKPGQAREAQGDCDFYVGQVNDGPYQTTADARVWVEAHFHPHPMVDLFTNPHDHQPDDPTAYGFPDDDDEIIAHMDDDAQLWDDQDAGLLQEADFLGYMPGDIE